MSRKTIEDLRRRTWNLGARLPARYKLLIVFILIMIPLTVGYGDEEQASVTVVNKTAHYLHIIIDGEPFLYVSTGMGVTHSSEPKEAFSVDALYSPGQGISARISRTISVPYTPASSGCGQGPTGGCECVTNPASAGATIWEITADTMLVEIPKTN